MPIHSICKSSLKENMYSVMFGVVLLLLAGAYAQSECPSGYELFNGKCYKLSVEKTCWEEARARCESSGGILAIPGSEDEILDILTVANEVERVWLGFTDLVEEGVFLDVNSNAMVFDTFGAGEPNGLDGEDCVEVHQNGFMNDLPCELSQSFVCTADASVAQELPCRCPASWTEYDGECYRFFGLSRNFDDSETNCASYVNGPNGHQAHLASITSDEENEFVTDLIDRSWPGSELTRTWLGGSDRGQEGAFEWTDNVAQGYSHWKVNQPDDADGEEDCIQINFRNRGEWNDVPCHLEFPSICKMPVYDPIAACQALAEEINKLVGECNGAVPF